MEFLRRAIGGMTSRAGARECQPRRRVWIFPACRIRVGSRLTRRAEISVSSVGTTNPEPALRRRWSAFARLMRLLCVAAGVAPLLLSTIGLAEAQSIRQGVSALHRQDYVSASHIFIPLAEQGVAAAQSY